MKTPRWCSGTDCAVTARSSASVLFPRDMGAGLSPLDNGLVA